MNTFKKIINPRLYFGLFLCALGTVLEIHSQIGTKPWSVFEQGLANILGISFGTANIMTSAVIIIGVTLCKFYVGFGTIMNMLVIGWLIDLINYLNIIPYVDSLWIAIIMVFLGIIANAVGTYFYMGCGLGCGPRDSLMTIFTQKTNLPVAATKTIIEGTVFVIGWRLGGVIGIGTIINVVFSGIITNLFFNMVHFDIRKVEHENILETFHIGKAKK